MNSKSDNFLPLTPPPLYQRNDSINTNTTINVTAPPNPPNLNTIDLIITPQPKMRMA